MSSMAHYRTALPVVIVLSIAVIVLVVVLVVVVVVVVVLVVLLVVVVLVVVHMYVAGSVLQCPSPVQLAVMMSLGRKPSTQVKVMDDPSNVAV